MMKVIKNMLLFESHAFEGYLISRMTVEGVNTWTVKISHSIIPRFCARTWCSENQQFLWRMKPLDWACRKNKQHFIVAKTLLMLHYWVIFLKANKERTLKNHFLECWRLLWSRPVSVCRTNFLTSSEYKSNNFGNFSQGFQLNLPAQENLGKISAQRCKADSISLMSSLKSHHPPLKH